MLTHAQFAKLEAGGGLRQRPHGEERGGEIRGQIKVSDEG